MSESGLSNTVRVVEIDGQPWFVAADVCRILGLSQVTNALRNLGRDEITLTQIKGFRGSHINTVSESGLYRLTMRSDKPEARQFQDWVTREVLPAIRKDGMYVVGEEKVKTGEMSE
ncbi:Bro-N domain-containing protein [Rhizobium sp. RU36D]|uniref:BRO-N domain-containing protein n=1 Tax=Rhizobium sp. RU36D TaxID=1907415 RepID=UPI0032AF1B94